VSFEGGGVLLLAGLTLGVFCFRDIWHGDTPKENVEEFGGAVADSDVKKELLCGLEDVEGTALANLEVAYSILKSNC
jgi:hypothetical protein